MADLTISPTERSHLIALKAALTPLQEQFSLSHLVSLLTIAAEPGLSVNELADRTGAPQATASRHVAVLLGRYQSPGTESPTPLITQQVNPDDPRRRALFLNGRGQEIVLAVLRSLSSEISSPMDNAE